MQNKIQTRLFIVLALLLTLLSTDAFAQRRSGLFIHGGVMMGGGGGSTSTSSGSTKSTISQDWKLDGGIDIGTGLPLTRMFVLTLNAYWYGQYRSANSAQSSFTNNLNVLAGTDVFIYNGFVVGGQLGFAYLQTTSKTKAAGVTTSISTDNPGWGLRFSTGYEFPLKKYALGIRGYYMHNFYYPSDSITASYNGLGGSVYLRWY